MASAPLVLPDLVDPKTYAKHDMVQVWRRLRAEEPVYWHRAMGGQEGFWVVTRYADIVQVLRDDLNFTVERGNALTTMLQGGDTGAGRMLSVTDGAHHADLRRLLSQALSPRRLADMRVRLRQLTRRLLTEAVARGRCDFARDVASVVPLHSICDLLDVPVADREHLLRLTKSALASDYEAPEAGVDRMARAEILMYFTDLLGERRKKPGTDPISLMATAEVAGRQLDDEEIVVNSYGLMIGGDETSRLAMIGAVHAFAQDSGQWRALRDRVVTVESATEEVLRWTTPTMHLGRSAVRDVQVGSRTVKAGDILTLWYTSANHDEEAFPEPDRFDLGRAPNKHLAFGYGRHFCLGAYLGRAEISAMLDGLRAFVAEIEQAGPGRRIYSNFLCGMSSLPVVLHGAPGGAAKWRD